MAATLITIRARFGNGPVVTLSRASRHKPSTYGLKASSNAISIALGLKVAFDPVER